MTAMRFRLRHWVTVCTATLVSLFVVVPGVVATNTAVRRSVLPVTSATWRAVATAQNATPINQPLVLTWAVSHGTAYQFFDIVNTGTLAVTSQTFHVTNVLDKSGNQKAPTVTFDACLGGSWVAINSCSGTVVALGSTTTEIFTTVNTPLPVGGRFSIQATTTPSGSSTYTTTVNISIDGSQIRPGRTIDA